MSASGPVKNIGRLTKSSLSAKRERKRTNKKLERWILTTLGIQEMRNPYTTSRGLITPLQISKQVPDSILQSADDILNTMYNMQEEGLIKTVEVKYGEVSFEHEEEETTFQITVDGIIQFRKYIRPIARLVINHEEQYQTKVDKTKGDAKVKAELKKVPEKIKDDPEVKAELQEISRKGDSKVKAELKKFPKKIIKKLEDKAVDAIVDTAIHHGIKPVIFLLSLMGAD